MQFIGQENVDPQTSAMIEEFASDAGFMAVMAGQAVKGFQVLGRGMLYVSLGQSAGTFQAGYFPLELMTLAQFSREMLGIVQGYNPATEVVVTLAGSGGFKVYRFGVERIGRSAS